ncbi:uncharacterized protein [Lolium perenne]|uniref:uncharacterized protein n=1 Tax=Lolium perenne TaxID=4522 RepID=UPI0021F525F3|nr:uncharacterized protein LOC127308658 isoform X2 [Lolium perenne]
MANVGPSSIRLSRKAANLASFRKNSVIKTVSSVNPPSTPTQRPPPLPSAHRPGSLVNAPQSRNRNRRGGGHQREEDELGSPPTTTPIAAEAGEDLAPEEDDGLWCTPSSFAATTSAARRRLVHPPPHAHHQRRPLPTSASPCQSPHNLAPPLPPIYAWPRSRTAPRAPFAARTRSSPSRADGRSGDPRADSKVDPLSPPCTIRHGGARARDSRSYHCKSRIRQRAAWRHPWANASTRAVRMPTKRPPGASPLRALVEVDGFVCLLAHLYQFDPHSILDFFYPQFMSLPMVAARSYSLPLILCSRTSFAPGSHPNHGLVGFNLGSYQCLHRSQIFDC